MKISAGINNHRAHKRFNVQMGKNQTKDRIDPQQPPD